MMYSKQIRDVFGNRAFNGPIFSFWTHFPDCDLDPERLAQVSVEMHKEFDLDFLKTAPNGMYSIEDYGVSIDFSEVPKGGIAKVTETPFENADAWANLPRIDIWKGALGRELQSLKLIREALPAAPVFFTVFSPITTASKLSQGKIREHIANREKPELVHQALKQIAFTTRALIDAAISYGATGVFFAHQDTSRELYSYDDFSEFVVPYDLEALVAANKASFNMLHIHGTSIRFHELLDYPVQAVNWHDWETLPSATAGLISSRKCIVGGIDRWSITRNDIEALKSQVSTTLSETQGMGDVILSPSCTVRAGFDKTTLHSLRDFVRSPNRLAAAS